LDRRTAPSRATAAPTIRCRAGLAAAVRGASNVIGLDLPIAAGVAALTSYRPSALFFPRGGGRGPPKKNPPAVMRTAATSRSGRFRRPGLGVHVEMGDRPDRPRVEGDDQTPRHCGGDDGRRIRWASGARPEHDDVRLGRTRDRARSTAGREPIGEQAGVGVIVGGQPVDVVVERVVGRRREAATWRIAPRPSPIAGRGGNERSRADQHRAARGAQTLGERDIDDVERPARSAKGTSSATAAFHSALRRGSSRRRSPCRTAIAAPSSTGITSRRAIVRVLDVDHGRGRHEHVTRGLRAARNSAALNRPPSPISDT